MRKTTHTIRICTHLSPQPADHEALLELSAMLQDREPCRRRLLEERRRPRLSGTGVGEIKTVAVRRHQHLDGHIMRTFVFIHRKAKQIFLR